MVEEVHLTNSFVLRSLNSYDVKSGYEQIQEDDMQKYPLDPDDRQKKLDRDGSPIEKISSSSDNEENEKKGKLVYFAVAKKWKLVDSKEFLD